MKILLNNNDLNEALYGVSNLGFVPTMGCLHNGHISLIKKSLKKCNKTLVSIFVDRLINIIKPKKIFMGEKDFQQLYLVKKYISNNYKTQIVASKTVRNKNKLALSSRNSLLNIDELTKAENFSKSLVLLKRKLLKNNNINRVLANKKKELSSLFGTPIDYLELRNIYNLKKTSKIKNSKLFVAYHVNKVRLIDNF